MVLPLCITKLCHFYRMKCACESAGVKVSFAILHPYLWIDHWEWTTHMSHQQYCKLTLCFITAASMWGLVALRLSDEEILPFNYSYYATELEVTFVMIFKQIMGLTCFRSVHLLFVMRSSNLEEHDCCFWLAEWSNGYKWESTGNACQFISPAQVNQRIQKGSSESGFWIEGMYAPIAACCACSILQTLYNFLVCFLLGSTDMENLGTMEKLSIEGQRHQRPVDDDWKGVHRAGRVVWKTMVQTPGKVFNGFKK